MNIRIGISSGAAVAGIIGKSKFLYDLWGDVVNTASRMESHGIAGRIQLSEATRLALIQPFSLEHRGVIDVKGKGEMSTWFLNNRALNWLDTSESTYTRTQYKWQTSRTNSYWSTGS